MKKKYTLFVMMFIVLNAVCLRAQYIQDHFKFVKQGFCTEAKDRKAKDFPYLIKCKSDGVWGLRKETLPMDSSNYFVLKNLVTDNYKYIGPVKPTDEIRGFDFNENYLLISFGSKEYQFFYSDFDKQDTLLITNYEVFKHFFYSYDNENINIMNNTAYMTRSYPGYSVVGKKFTTFNTTISKEGKMGEFHYFPMPKGEYLGVEGQSNVFSLSSKYIALSDRSRYKIYFYDYNYNKVDSIFQDWAVQNKIPDSVFYKYEDTLDINTKFSAGNIMKHLKTSHWMYFCNYLFKINFLNDSMLLVHRIEPMPGADTLTNFDILSYYKYDIWQYRNNKWELYLSNLDECKMFDNKKVNNNCIDLFLDYQIGGNYLFIPSSIPFKIEKEISFDEYKKKKDEYYLENSDPHGYFIYRFDK